MAWTDGPWSTLVIALVGLLGVAGVALGTAGLYLTLADSDPRPDRGAAVLGESACEPAHREVAGVPGADYGIERVMPRGEEVEAVETERTDRGVRITLSLAGRVLNATTAGFGDSPGSGPTATVENDTRVVVTDPDPAPFRLWIDSVTGEGTVVRTELDVCPPADGEGG